MEIASQANAQPTAMGLSSNSSLSAFLAIPYCRTNAESVFHPVTTKLQAGTRCTARTLSKWPSQETTTSGSLHQRSSKLHFLWRPFTIRYQKFGKKASSRTKITTKETIHIKNCFDPSAVLIARTTFFKGKQKWYATVPCLCFWKPETPAEFKPENRVKQNSNRR